MAKLSDLLAEQHSDPWMQDFLKASRPEQRDAARALSEAISANVQGFPDKAAEKAGEAAERFANSHNTPGELRAGLEQVYAEQRKLKGQKCIALAEDLRRKLSATNYRWGRGQLALEDATCSNLKARLDVVAENLEFSRRTATEFQYPVMGLRTLALDASFRRQRHEFQESWQELKEGLRLYHEDVYPTERLYNFYSVLEQYLEDRNLPNAQRALLSQAIEVRKHDAPEDANLILTASIYFRLANSFAGSRKNPEAKDATQKARAFLARVPKKPTVARYVLYLEIDAALGQLRVGAPDLALATLEPSRELLPAIEHDFMFVDFNRILGDSYRQVRQFDEAMRSYESGIVTAERALSTLENEADRLQWMNGAGQLYGGLVLSLLDQHKDREALQVWEWSRDRFLTEQRPLGNRSWLDLSREIHRPLIIGYGTHIVYASLSDRLQIWFADGGEIRSKSIPIKQQDLESLVEEFARECANPNSDLEELSRHSLKLSELFLQPFASDLRSSQPVAIELDPKLFRLPLAALMGPGNSYLADQHPFTISPGLWMEESLRKPKMVGHDELVLVLDASPSSGPGHLPGHEQLSKTVAEVFPSASVEQPVNVAWKTASRQLSRSEALIFIGHGVHSSAGTALVYGNTHLTAKDFSPELLHRLDLAVLIACSSGAAGDSGLLEADSLVRPFLSAGVPWVIASRWDVDSRTSARLMEDFHRRVGRGEGIASALSLARKQIRSEKPHPYYWAAFDLDGRMN